MEIERMATGETAGPAAQPEPLLDVFEPATMESARGEGVHVIDREGRRYLDFYGGHAVALLGYGHPRLVAALDAQARRLFFQSNAVAVDVRRRAAEALLRFAGGPWSRVFFVNSGAEANENALRVAFLKTRRSRVVAVEGAFHGRTAAAAALTHGSERWYAFPSRPFTTTHVPFDDAAALEAAMENDVAAVIVEPVQGIAGARPLSRTFLAAARDLATRSGAVLIFDEVQCGMGRSGYPFAFRAFDVVPDILTTAKGLAGGFPVGAVLLPESLAAAVRRGDLGTTFGGGPLAMALVETVVQVIGEEGILPRVRALSSRLMGAAGLGPVEAVQGLGFLLGLRVTRPARDVLRDLQERGILAGGSHDPRVVRLLPPLVLEDAHVTQFLDVLREIPA